MTDDKETDDTGELMDFATLNIDSTGEAATAAGLDRIAVYHTMFVILARVLTEAGWTVPELLSDVGFHAADQGSEGRA